MGKQFRSILDMVKGMSEKINDFYYVYLLLAWYQKQPTCPDNLKHYQDQCRVFLDEYEENAERRNVLNELVEQAQDLNMGYEDNPFDHFYNRFQRKV